MTTPNVTLNEVKGLEILRCAQNDKGEGLRMTTPNVTLNEVKGLEILRCAQNDKGEGLRMTRVGRMTKEGSNNG